MPLSKPFAFLGSSAAGLEPVQTNLEFWVDSDDSNSYPGTGTTWYDISPSGTTKDFTLINSPTYTAGPGGSFTFNGTSQYASYNPGAHEWWDYSTSPSFTFEYVVNYAAFDDTKLGSILTQWGSTTSNQVFLQLLSGNSNGRFDHYMRNNATNVTLFTNLNNTYQNQWMHLFVEYAYNAGTGDYDLTGTINNSTTATATWGSYTAFVTTATAASEIGRRANGDLYYEGKIGVIRFYNGLLTADEKTQNYDYENAKYNF